MADDADLKRSMEPMAYSTQCTHQINKFLIFHGPNYVVYINVDLSRDILRL